MAPPALRGLDLNLLNVGSAPSGDQSVGFSRKQIKRSIPARNGGNARIIDESELGTAGT